MTKEFSFNHF